MSRLLDAWRARQPRERTMLVVMALAIGAFAYWYGGVVPLRHLADGARDAHDRAARRLAVVRGNLAAIRAARDARPQVPQGPAYAAAILASAQAKGVSPSRQRPREDGGLAVGIDAVDAPALFAWLDALRSTHGIAPDTLEVGRRGGRLHAEVAFPGE